MDINKINELDILQSQENDGRGVSCVRSIVFYLRQNDEHTAKVVYQNKGDKILQYPKIQQWMEENFGCRLHLKINCDGWLCERIRR